MNNNNNKYNYLNIEGEITELELIAAGVDVIDVNDAIIFYYEGYDNDELEHISKTTKRYIFA